MFFRVYLLVLLLSWELIVDFQPYKLSTTVTESNSEYALILSGSFVDSRIGVTVGPAEDDAASDVSPNDLDGAEADETASEADDSAVNWPCPAVTREGRVGAAGFSGVVPIAP